MTVARRAGRSSTHSSAQLLRGTELLMDEKLRIHGERSRGRWHSGAARSQACGSRTGGSGLRHKSGRSRSGGHQFINREASHSRTEYRESSRRIAKPHSSALWYRYLTSFKATLLSEFCFTTANANDSDGQSGLLCPMVQTSTCSAMARASSTSMPRYLTVLSIRVWPSRS